MAAAEIPAVTISDLSDRGRVKIVFDLGGLTYIDSSGVGMIVFQQKALRQRELRSAGQPPS